MSAAPMAARLPGSPPRGWGKLARPRANAHPHRFTPTRVGKTMRCDGCSAPTPVHPHAGGENALGSDGCPRPTVHPHAGGENSIPITPNLKTNRFTPTRVGKTLSVRSDLSRSSVHPHAGGENVRSSARLAACPVHPHAGGENDVLQACQANDLRFTPTRVGKTVAKTADGLF